MKGRLLFLVVLTGIALCSRPSSAEKNQIIVGISITADELNSAPISSCLRTELRKFSDIEIGDFGNIANDLDLIILVQPANSEQGSMLGYSLAYFAISYLSRLPDVFMRNLKPEVKQLYLSYMHLEGAGILTDGDLGRICARTIAHIDTSVFEHLRQMRNALRKAKPQSKAQ